MSNEERRGEDSANSPPSALQIQENINVEKAKMTRDLDRLSAYNDFLIGLQEQITIDQMVGLEGQVVRNKQYGQALHDISDQINAITRLGHPAAELIILREQLFRVDNSLKELFIRTDSILLSLMGS